MLCVGHQPAITSRDNLQLCMECFIIPARTREARCHFSGGKQEGSSLSEVPRGKIVKMAEARKEIRQCPGSWQIPLPSPFPRPATDRPHISPFPPPSSVLEEEEESEDTDIETVFSSKNDVLSCGQEKAGDNSAAVLRRSSAGRLGLWMLPSL